MRVKVTIARYVGDNPQPGIVECHLTDAYGRVWTIIEKTAIPHCTEYLGSGSSYPLAGEFACTLVAKSRDLAGTEVFRIETDKWGVGSVEGVMQFDVLRDALVLDPEEESA
jgi:hypothetical protein